MKHEADWKIFFNGNEEKFGSWRTWVWDITIHWKKTDIIDGSDTVYTFIERPFHDEDNPLQLDDGRQLVYFGDIDGIDTYYFTCSSGLIAYYYSGGDYCIGY